MSFFTYSGNWKSVFLWAYLLTLTGWVVFLLVFPCCFSINNSQTVIAVILAFRSIHYHFIKNICAKFGIRISPQSPYIEQNSDGLYPISRFLVNPLKKENCRNSRTGDNTDMKLGPVTKLTRETRHCQKI